MKVDRKSDYLESKQIMMSIVVTFIVPLFFLTWIKRHTGEGTHFPDDTAPQLLVWQIPCAVFQGISVIVLSFVSFRGSPWPANKTIERNYLSIVPQTMFAMTIISFVVIPIGTLIMCFSSSNLMNQSAFQAGLWLYCLT